MSKTLNQIRLAFHDQIVIREGKQFVLTERGEQLKHELPALILQLDNLYQPKSMQPNCCQRKFTFASSDYVAQAILPSITCKMELEAPNASIEYQLWQKEKLTELADSQLDLVSTMSTLVPENLHGKMMAEDQLVAVFHSSHIQSNCAMSVSSYCNARHILISGGGDKDSSIDTALSTIGKHRNIFATVPFFQSAIELLLQTETILTIPLHIAADFAQRYDLQIRELPITIKAQHYYLLWHAKHHNNPEHKWFRELCYPLLKKHLEVTIKQGMKLLHTNK